MKKKSKKTQKTDEIAQAAWSPEPFNIGDGVEAQIERDGDEAIILRNGGNTIILARDAWESLVEFVELTDIANALARARSAGDTIGGERNE